MSSVDTGYAWLIPFSCFMIQGTLFGTYRSYSLLYTVLLENFGVSRSDASWPVSLCMTMIHLTGPVSGSLNRKFSVRTISFVGCLLSAAGVALCFFAEEGIGLLTIGIGVVQGFGIGLTYVQSAAIINQYFVRHRATANGINLSGGTVGAFTMSYVLEWALRNYEFQDCFLILSGVILLTLPFCLLLRPFREEDEPIVSPESGLMGIANPAITGSIASDLSSISTVTEHTLHKSTTHLIPVSNGGVSNNISQQFYAANLVTAGTAAAVVGSGISLKSYTRDEAHVSQGLEKAPTSASGGDGDENEKRMQDQGHTRLAAQRLRFEKADSLTSADIVTGRDGIWRQRQMSTVSTTTFVRVESVWRAIFVLLRDPMFLLIAMTHVAYFWSSITFQMIEVDFALDIGISAADGVSLITAFSVGDLIGRLGSGPLLDREFIGLRVVAMSCSLGNGVFMASAILLTTYWPLVLISGILGFISGVINVLLNQLFCKYVGSDQAALAFGVSAFLCGALTTVRPLVVGSFRDQKNGSYNGLLVCLGVLSVGTGLLWVFEPLIMRRRQEKQQDILSS